MSDIKRRLQEDIKTALRAGDKARLGTLRLALSEVKRVEIDSREELSDADAQALMLKLIKQRRESIAQFEQAGRVELAAKEAEEIQHIMPYLPEQLDERATREAVAKVLAELGVKEIRDMGKAMGALKSKLQGRADMSLVSKIVKEHLSGG